MLIIFFRLCFPIVVDVDSTVPAVGRPMHGIDFGQMSSQSSPAPHLDPADRLEGARRLGQARVAGRLPCILIVVIVIVIKFVVDNAK